LSVEEKLRVVEGEAVRGHDKRGLPAVLGSPYPVLSLGKACQARSPGSTVQWHPEVQERQARGVAYE
jgi:hypothetical protein